MGSTHIITSLVRQAIRPKGSKCLPHTREGGVDRASGTMNLIPSMSTPKRSSKRGQVHPLTTAKVLAQYKHLPPTLLKAIDRAMEFTTPREMGESIRRAFELAMFHGGAHEGIEKQDCNVLLDAFELSKAFLEHDRDEQEQLLKAV